MAINYLHFRLCFRNHLRALEKAGKTKEDSRLVRRFVSHYLRQDGVLVLRLIGINASQLVAAEIIAELWKLYRTSHTGLLNSNGRANMETV